MRTANLFSGLGNFNITISDTGKAKELAILFIYVSNAGGRKPKVKDHLGKGSKLRHSAREKAHNRGDKRLR